MKKVLPFILTLRGRLILLICLATLPAILFTFYIAYNERSAALTRMEDDARHIVSLVSREQLYQMDGAKSLLEWLSDLLVDEDRQALVLGSDFLATLLAGYPQLGNIAILTPEGDVINSAYPLPAPINMHDYDAVQRALRSQTTEIGSYVIGPIVQRPLLHMTYAVRDGLGNIRWVVFVAIDLEWLEQLTERVELPAEHILLIVDRDGNILATSTTLDGDAFAIGQTIPELASAGMMGSDPQSVSVSMNGERLSFATSPMREISGVLVATALPTEQIYQKANGVFYRTLGWLSLLTLFTVVSVVVVEEIALLRAVRALSSASQRFGKGDYSARVTISHGFGELKDMADAFNAMAEALTHRHHEISEAHHRMDRLTQHLQFARESEAKRISRDLHDEVGQVLTSIKMDIARFRSKCSYVEASSNEDCVMNGSIGAIQTKIDNTVDYIRRIASDLRPPVLDRMGLISAIDLLARNLEENAELIVNVESDELDQPLDWLISTSIYRILQEALTNVTRHAQATEIQIDLRKKDQDLILTVRDNGQGFEQARAQTEALGIIGMRERARLVNGTFLLESAPGKGTRIEVCIPVATKQSGTFSLPPD
tara:strand:- start:153 stop:1952 length:1800 start_codon:yes stop_codon:yes gene_type:complete